MTNANTVTIQLCDDDAERIAVSMHLHIMQLYKQGNMQAADELRRIGRIVYKARFPN
jgi:hypothetical protein